LQINYKIK